MDRLIVRRGGFETGRRYVFDLTGGAVCLDFVNTLDERRGEAKELLTEYARLLQWCEQTKLFQPAKIGVLEITARNHAVAACKALVDARKLRESLFAIFHALVQGADSSSSLVNFNAWVERADSRRMLVRKGPGFAWSYEVKDPALNCMLWPIVDSALKTLIDEDLRTRVRMCSGPGCAWLFLDYSRRRDRKWCDMSVCGNRVKARRFYHANKQD
jgi:predicted RNA-binding Zn ribbon-like protein